MSPIGMRFFRPDEENKYTESGLADFHRITAGVGDLAGILSEEIDPQHGLRRAVSLIGKAAGVGAACIVQMRPTDERDDMVLTVRHGWVAEDATAQLTVGTLDGRTLGELGLTRWNEILLAAHPALQVEEDERSTLLQKGISGIAAFPITKDRHLWGALVLIDALHEIKLDAGHAAVLGIAVNMIESQLATKTPSPEQTDRELPDMAVLLRAVTASANLLFTSTGDQDALNAALAALGDATGVSSVRLFEVYPDPLDGEPMVSIRSTWQAPEHSNNVGPPELESQPIYGSGFEQWYQELLDGKLIRGTVDDRPESEREVLAREGVRSFLSIPIFIDGRLWGDITFVNRNVERRWHDDEITILRLAATSIAESLARYRSHELLERRRVLLGAVADISTSLLTAEDPAEGLQQTVDILGEAAGVSRAAIYQFHPHPETGLTSGSKRAEWTAPGIESRMDVPEVQNSPYEGNPVLSEWYHTLISGEIFGGVTRNFDDPLRSFLQGYNVRSILLTPMETQNGHWGFVGLYDELRDREWTEDERAILRTAGSIIASAIDRRRAQHSLRRRGVLLNAVAEASGQLLAGEDFPGGLQQASAIIGRAAEVSRVTIYEFHPHPDTGLTAATKQIEWTEPDTVPRIGTPDVENVPFEQDEALDAWYQALSEGQSVGGSIRHLPEVTRDFFERFGVRSIFLMPIMTGKGVWGYIGFDDDTTEREWSEDEQAILRTAATIIAGAIDRRRSDAALRASDARFRAMIQNSSDVIIVLDRDGRIPFVSPSITAEFGYDPDDLIGEIPFTIIHPDDQPRIQEHLRQLFEEGVSSTRNEFRVLHAEGHWRYVETVTNNLLQDPRVEGIVVTVRDATERKQAEQDLERKSELLQAVAEATSALLIHTDLDQGIPAALERIGQAARASRAAIFRFHLDPDTGLHRATKRYEWTAPHIAGRLDESSIRDLPFEGALFDDWYQAFKRGETVSGYIDDFPQKIREHFDPFGVRSLLLMPVVIDDHPEGFIILDDETRDHFWSDDEQAILRASSSAIAGAIARRLADEALQRSEERFRAMIQHSSDIISLLDEQGYFQYVSSSIEHVLGLSPANVAGRDSRDFIHADSLMRWEQTLNEVVEADPGFSRQIDVRHRTDSGGWRMVEVIVTNHLNDPRVNALVVNTRDITERKQLEERLSWQAFHDPLTGLANRSLFLVRLEHANARTQRHAESFAVLFIDLDRFKIINDSLGHAAGDDLLVILARRLQLVLRPTDTISRFGGDEFTVLLDDLNDRGDVSQIIERILASLREPMTLPSGNEVAVNASVGVALSTPRERPTSADLLRNADIALYRAKASGRGRWEIYDHDMNSLVIERHRLETEIRRAIDHNELTLWYQPEVDLHSMNVTNIEALVRWNHPQHGMLAPDEFIAVAEESGLIVSLGRWVLRDACARFQDWREQGVLAPDVTLSVNLSATEFRQSDLVDEVRGILDETGLDPYLLRLEFTESAVIQEIAATPNVLGDLHELGVLLAIDDFGTGYSSLSYLSQLPIRLLKIAPTFINASDVDRNLAIIDAVATLAHGLGMRVTAEGIETHAQLQRLLSATACDYGQGFYFSHPVDAAEIPALLAGRGQPVG